MEIIYTNKKVLRLNIFPKKWGDVETPFVPITCHVIMGNKGSIACYIIGMLHLIWHN
jgi:hypothetical protein